MHVSPKFYPTEIIRKVNTRSSYNICLENKKNIAWLWWVKDCPGICYKQLVVRPIPFIWALVMHA
jgi:hypothetical protein